MLQNIRESTQSGWTYFIVGLLIVVFAVFYGLPGDSFGKTQRRAKVAQVQGMDIYNTDVNVVFNRNFGGQRSVSDGQIAKQKDQSLKSLVLVYLLSEKAKLMGLRVGPDEFVKYIKDPLRNPEFRGYAREGVWDGPYYKAYIQNRLRMQIPDYEEYKRKEILAFKYVDIMRMQFHETDKELNDLNALRNTLVDLEFAKFDAEKIKEFVSITDAEATSFASANADKIKKYYDDHAKEYKTEGQLQVRRIFIKTDEKEEGKQKALFEKAKKRVLENKENFANVAGEMTEDYSKEKQGLMDWTPLANLDENIAKALKDASIGDVKEVSTKFAHMLVKLEGKKEEKITTLAEATSEIAKTLLRKSKANDFTKKLLAEFSIALKEKGSFTDALASLKPAKDDAKEEDEEEVKSKWDAVSIDTTGEFSMEGQDLSKLFGGQFSQFNLAGLGGATWNKVPKIGTSTKLVKAAFKLTKESPDLGEPIKIDNATYFIKLKEKKTPSEESLKEEKGKLVNELRAEKQKDILGSPFAFIIPSPDFGDFFESIYESGIKDGKVKLYKEKSKVDAVTPGKKVINLSQPSSKPSN